MIKGTLGAAERIEQIRHRVDADGRVKIAALAQGLGVSEMTVRRDLEILEHQGVLRRVRGGAVAIGPEPFAQRFGRRASAKQRIAEKLIPLVGDGGAIGIDASTTLQRLAAALPRLNRLTVVTNGQDTFAALQHQGNVVALLTGGQLDSQTGSLVGPLACGAASDLLLRRLFVSAAGVNQVHGSSKATLEEAAVKLAMASVGGEIVLAADSSKLDQSGPARCLSFDRLSIMVTELDPRHPRLDPYRELVELV